nr:hypothetical protein CTI12_AA145900 [Tanacetum cinerariifolium]
MITTEDAMPWVGLYVAGASLACTLAMAADAFQGFRQWKLWFKKEVNVSNSNVRSEMKEYAKYVLQIEDTKLSERISRNALKSINQLLSKSEKNEPARRVWTQVEVYRKWLQIDLKKKAHDEKTSKEILEWLRDEAVKIVVQFKSCKKRRMDDSHYKFIVASSMYRVSETILIHCSEQENWPIYGKLLEWISNMIADILCACFTNLPCVIKMMCHHDAIEKREDNSVRSAAQLLGKSRKILKILNTRQLPNLDVDSMADIDVLCKEIDNCHLALLQEQSHRQHMLHGNSEACGLMILQEPTDRPGQLAVYLGNPSHSCALEHVKLTCTGFTSRMEIDTKTLSKHDFHDFRSVEIEFPTIVFNDNFTLDETLSCEPTVSSLNDNQIDFGISFDESDDEDYTVIYDKNSFSYKIISVDDLKTDLKNDNDKVNIPSFSSPKLTVSYFNDLEFFKDFENEFPVIVYNDALTSILDFLTKPAVRLQHIDEFNLKEKNIIVRM